MHRLPQEGWFWGELMQTIEYGHALYYPHINFRSRRWLRTAALYHDNIARIVPNGAPVREEQWSDEQKALYEDRYALESAGFLEIEVPDANTHGRLANEFYVFAKDTLRNPVRRKLSYHLSRTAQSRSLCTNKKLTVCCFSNWRIFIWLGKAKMTGSNATR